MSGETEIAFCGKDGPKLAYRQREGSSPTIVFLPGYASDMEGRFEDGTLEGWLDEALLLIDRLTEGLLVIVGSSMGGWIALHVALRRPDRVKALVGIAAAPDFSEWGYSAEDKLKLVAEGRLEQPNPYGAEPHLTTRAFWESAETLRLLHAEIAIDCPVRLVHGDKDEEVPVEIATRLMGRLRSGDVQMLIVKDGGHRLSRDHEIAAILRTVELLVEPRE